MSYKKRNPIAKDLERANFRQQVRDRNRRRLIDELRDQEAEEDLHEYFGLGKAPKE